MPCGSCQPLVANPLLPTPCRQRLAATVLLPRPCRQGLVANALSPTSCCQRLVAKALAPTSCRQRLGADTLLPTSCPGGTFDNSPAIYRWVAGAATSQSPVGTIEIRARRSAVPTGRARGRCRRPSDKSLGYSHTPRRGVWSLAVLRAAGLGARRTPLRSVALGARRTPLRGVASDARRIAPGCGETQGGLRPRPDTGTPAPVMRSEAKHPACLRQSAGFFVAALLRMTGGATAAARSMCASLAKAATQDSDPQPPSPNLQPPIPSPRMPLTVFRHRFVAIHGGIFAIRAGELDRFLPTIP